MLKIFSYVYVLLDLHLNFARKLLFIRIRTASWSFRRGVYFTLCTVVSNAYSISIPIHPIPTHNQLLNRHQHCFEVTAGFFGGSQPIDSIVWRWETSKVVLGELPERHRAFAYRKFIMATIVLGVLIDRGGEEAILSFTWLVFGRLEL